MITARKKPDMPNRNPRRRAQIDAATLPSRERLRRKYRPKRIRLLFVGEAPPASGRFFYLANSGLYRAIRDTFVAAFPALESRDTEFLDSFQAAGCYLVDLCGKPVDRMEPRLRRRACQAGEARLARTLRKLRPEVVVTIVRSIDRNVRRAEASAEWSGPHIVLPYPGRWHRFRVIFRRKLTPLLRATLGTQIIDTPVS
jgi:hypothetical protein